MIPLISLALAAVSSETEEKTPRQELYERFQAEFPELLLEETLGLTVGIEETLGEYLSEKAVHQILAADQMDRLRDWHRAWPWTSQVWIELAKRPRVRKAVLEILSEDESHHVRAWVVRHPHVPVEILVRLAKDPFFLVQSWVAVHPSTPEDVLLDYVDSEETSIRSSLARNLALPERLAWMLFHDESLSVQVSLARNPSIPEEILKELIEQDEIELLRVIAVHPRLSLQLAERLAKDEDEDVRTLARKNPVYRQAHP